MTRRNAVNISAPPSEKQTRERFTYASPQSHTPFNNAQSLYLHIKLTMTDWNKLKVIDLKAELKKRGLAQTGLKPALVARLAASENEDGSESETTIQDDANKLDTNSATSPDTVSPTVPTSEVSADLPSATPLQPTTETTEPFAAPRSIPQDPPIVDTQTETLPTQSTNTVESSQAPEQNDKHESALPSVEPQEAIDDRQKRKRRSQSPPPSTADSARKRFRTNEDGEQMDGVVTSQEDADWVEKYNAVDAGEVNSAAREVALYGVELGHTIVDDSKEEVKIDDVQMSGVGEPSPDEKMEVDDRPKREAASVEDESPSRTRDSRFKSLFSGEVQGTSMAISKSHDSAYEEGEPDRVIDPAIHPATSALYIRDLMRPLNQVQLKSHLATLAAPPGQEPDLDVLVSFYLDTIRTHAFISFTNTSAASRVRSALHDRIWPDEKTRKPLWVDFVPVEKLDEWIEQEQGQPGGRGVAKKWEVYYDVDEDRHVTAILQESNNLRPAQPIRRPSVPVPPVQAPQAPRRIENAPSAPRSFNIRGQGLPTNTARLDELFKSTTAKPMLYYQPVSKAVANKRLDNIDAAISKDAAVGNRMAGPINRYTFEDGDKLVDRGPEIFPGIRPPPGQRPGGGGGRGGPPRDRDAGFRDGGFRGRGGGGYRDRAPERVYESFRPGRMDDRRY